MKFLIDGHRDRIAFRKTQWPEGVVGQLLTPLTRYTRGESIFAIDNGAYSGFREKEFISLLKREYHVKEQCLFVCVPDKVGDHKTTLEMWAQYNHLANGWKKAFVVQDGCDSIPNEADCVFIGGTTEFKDSEHAADIVLWALENNKHVHIGRVNGPERFAKFHVLGAHTCDGSGVSRYDHMILAIKEAMERIKCEPML